MQQPPAAAGMLEDKNIPVQSSSNGFATLTNNNNNHAVIYGVLSIVVLELVLNRSGLRSSVLRILWTIFVYLAPSRIIAALKSRRRNTTMLGNFQAKDVAMQRAFGLNDNDGDSSSSSSSPRPPTSRPSSSSFSSYLSPAKYIEMLGGGGGAGGPTNHLPPGLGNWDNSCYQNSIIQGLASLRTMTEFLDRNVEYLLSGEESSFTTHKALRDILGRLNSPANSDRNLWTPAALKSMSSWQQQDAQEYFSKILEQLDREVLQASRRQTTNLGLKVAGPGEHIIGSSSSSANLKTSAQYRQAVEERSSLRNPFEGLLAQRVGCMRCGWTEGLSLFQFNCITVPLVGGRECSVRDCLDQYMDLESIEGVECAKCTLLRAREQLQNLVQQVKGDDEGASSTLRASVLSRLKAVQGAIEEEDFSDKTLSNQCRIPPKNRVSSTKSRQSVVARAPQCLAIHINRSLFDEYTGMLRKNYAEVRFPKMLDLGEWCLGGGHSVAEEWDTDPRKSMIARNDGDGPMAGSIYELRALITHYGRHENGHYICYRKYAADNFPADVPEAVLEADGGSGGKDARWFRLSDENVQMVSEQHVLSQGGGFMLLYEAVDYVPPPPADHDVEKQSLLSAASSINTADDMSMASADGLTQDDSESVTSRTLSVSPPAPDRVIPPIEQQDAFSKFDPSCGDVDNHKSDDDGLAPSPDIITTV